MDGAGAPAHSGMAPTGVPSVNLRSMRLDPNMHALVLGTAFLTSITFTIFALNVIALVLHYVLS